MDNANRTAPQQENISYSEIFYFYDKNAPIDQGNDKIVAVGYVDHISSEYPKENGNGNYMYVDLSVTMSDRTVESRFGPDFLRTNHRVRFSIAYSGMVLENFKEKNIGIGDKIRFGAQGLQRKMEAGQNGKNYYKITGFAVGNPKLVSAKSANTPGTTDSRANTPPQASAYAPPAQPWQQSAPVQTPYQNPVPQNAQPYPPAASTMPANQRMNPVSAAPQSMASSIVCADCGSNVTAQEAEYCQKNTAKFNGKVLCRKCQKNYANGAPAPARNAAPAAPGQQSNGYVCAKCNSPVSEKIGKYCLANSAKFGGQVYCMNCQNTVGNPPAAPASPQYAPPAYAAGQNNAFAAPAQNPVYPPTSPQMNSYNTSFGNGFSSVTDGLEDEDCPF